jgi:hypothetical protein
VGAVWARSLCSSRRTAAKRRKAEAISEAEITEIWSAHRPLPELSPLQRFPMAKSGCAGKRCGIIMAPRSGALPPAPPCDCMGS